MRSVSFHQPGSTGRLATALIAACGLLGLSIAPAVTATPSQQSECFSPDLSRYCIDEPAFRSYFDATGGAASLGYPISNELTLEGFRVQFFQRVVLQLQSSGVARLNLLDDAVLPLTRANGSIFPPPDPAVTGRAPPPDTPAYANAVLTYLSTVAPDRFEGVPVNFSTRFRQSVPAGPDAGIDTLRSLEIWGFPTSAPAYDPANHGFIYQRFQRGIMHYRTDCGCTDGILVGDYLKGVMTGRDLPDDLAADMRASRYFAQYAPGAPGWLARPDQLPDTDLTSAFEPGAGSIPPAGGPAATPTSPTATPTSPEVATATPAPIASTPTPTAGAVTSATLNGNVSPARAGVLIRVQNLPFSATTGSSGEFSLSGLPLGDITLYGLDGQVQTEAARLTLPHDPVVLPLVPITPGIPVVFRGRVLDMSGNPVKGATVWRLLGSSRAVTGDGGYFTLVDAYVRDVFNARTSGVNFVASAGNRWGLQFVDFSRGTQLQTLDVKLDRQGQLQTMPRVIAELPSGVSTRRHVTSDQNHDDVFLSLLWTSATGSSYVANLPLLNVPDAGRVQSSTDNRDCWGACGSQQLSWVVVRLPANQAVTIDPGPNPDWTSAQVTAAR